MYIWEDRRNIEEAYRSICKFSSNGDGSGSRTLNLIAVSPILGDSGHSIAYFEDDAGKELNFRIPMYCFSTDSMEKWQCKEPDGSVVTMDRSEISDYIERFLRGIGMDFSIVDRTEEFFKEQEGKMVGNDVLDDIMREIKGF